VKEQKMNKIKPSTLLTIASLLLVVAAAAPYIGKFVGYLSFD